jgi:hypothetical protein
MATYKGIQGFTIQNLSADPSNPIEGQVWYNSTSNVWKVEEATTAGSWATGGPLNTARESLAGAGTQTAGLAFGGTAPPNTGATEEYNGATWATSPNSMATARRAFGSCGTQTAALAFGGIISTNQDATEEYDGSTWTAGGSMGTARRFLGGAGTQTAALGFGGYAALTNTEEYNGTTWTANPTGLNTGRNAGGSAGTQTGSFIFWWCSTYYRSNRRI